MHYPGEDVMSKRWSIIKYYLHCDYDLWSAALQHKCAFLVLKYHEYHKYLYIVTHLILKT